MRLLGSVDDRIDLARRVARPAALALWVGSAFLPLAGVPGTWLVAPLALAVAAMALSPRLTSDDPPRPWTVGCLAFAVACVGLLRAASHDKAPEFGVLLAILLCGELPLIWAFAALGGLVDGKVAPGLAGGRGRMRVLTIVVALLGLGEVAVAASRFPGRVEPTIAGRLSGETLVSAPLGMWQELGARCPPRCDQWVRGARNSPAPFAFETSHELLPGVSLHRRRTGTMTTRLWLTVAPPGRTPRVSFERTLYAGHTAQLSRDPSGRFVYVDVAQHPRVMVRLADGEAFTMGERARQSPYHAPTAYVLGALAGVAMAAWFVSRARRTRALAEGQEAWRDAEVKVDGMVHFDREQLPAALPEGAPLGPRRVVVTRATVPQGVAYRSDGVVTIDAMFTGSRDALLERIAARATAWEHGAFACVLVTNAPLAAAWLLGDTW